tara:strand:+ start:3351 stop:5306 length:1956 start_codon:yes stop_codon:yes gene_type:complete
MVTDSIVETNISVDDHVDTEIEGFLNPLNPQSFFLFAGAGSGKTRSLVNALNHVQKNHGEMLSSHGRQVGVITYTNAACDEINRRVKFHSLFYVATIHRFAWELIKGFHSDIRDWLRENLNFEILKLKEEEEKGREGTKASIIRKAQIKSKSERLDRLDSIMSFSYSPTGENKEPNSLNHSEVISICSNFIAHKPILRWILVGRFPFLLVDESQDTNKHLIDALFIVANEHSDRFALGLIGDVMQQIYADGKERIEEVLPQTWAKPSKKLNHRCPRRVVGLINKIREQVDTHTQDPRSDAEDGYVKLYIRPVSVADKNHAEDHIRRDMASTCNDELWNVRENCKILVLEHHMAAQRLGFENIFTELSRIESWRTALLDGSLPSLRFFTQSVLPLVALQRQGDRFYVARILRQNSPLITEAALREASDPALLLKQAKTGVEALAQIWEKGEPTCGEVLLCIAKHNLLVIPDILLPVLKVLKAENDAAEKSEDENFLEKELADVIKSFQEDDETDDPINPETAALLSAMTAPFSEIDVYQKYVSGLAPFDTHQGVKGLEFDRVMVIIDDSEARGFMFGYDKLFGAKAASKTDIKNISEGRETGVDRTRRLLYVTCSRAERSLALVMYTENPDAVKNHVLENNWFQEDEIHISN